MSKLYDQIAAESKDDPDFVTKSAYIYIWLNRIALVVILIIFAFTIYYGLRHLYPSLPYSSNIDVFQWILVVYLLGACSTEYILKKYCAFRYKKLENNEKIKAAAREFVHRDETANKHIGVL